MHMDESVKNYRFSTFFSKGQYETQVETLEVQSSDHNITIGIPKEKDNNEHRVPIVPPSIRTITGYGHNVLVEREAGKESNYDDHHYSEAGARIVDVKSVYESDIIVKTSPPNMEELEYLKTGQILITPLHMPIVNEAYLNKLIQKKVVAISSGMYRAEDGSYPIIKIHSEIAGKSAILTAADLLNNINGGRGALLGSVVGVPPAKVLIIGAGVVGEYATKTAIALGASVRIFDNDINKLSRIQARVGRHLHTSSLNPEYLAYQLMSADVVIGAVHSKTGRSPVIVSEEMVSHMKSGSVIIDVCIDQGGCIETSALTSHEKPTFIKHGVIHYCVPNIASKVARTASQAMSNILTPLILKMGSKKDLNHLLYEHGGIRNAVYAYKGRITNEHLAKRHKLKYTALELLLTASL